METARTRKEAISTFMDFAIAVMIVGATVATLGGAAAAAAVLAGAAAATTVASAGVKLSNAADLRKTADAGITPQDKMTSQVKASAAELDAAIATATAILAALPFLKGLLLSRSASSIEQLTQLRSGKLSESAARKAVTASIREIGPAQTAQAAGMKVEDLFKYLEVGTSEYKLALEVALTLRAEGGVAASAVNFKGRPVAPTSTNWTGWHGSPASPEELRATGGFQASGTNTDLYEHIVEKGKPSAFRGTTATPLSPTAEGGGGHWGGAGQRAYKINAGEAWDTNSVWQRNQDIFTGAHPLPGEFEVAIRGTVPWERIEGWYEVAEGTRVEQLKLGKYVTRTEWEAGQALKAKGRR